MSAGISQRMSLTMSSPCSSSSGPNDVPSLDMLNDDCYALVLSYLTLLEKYRLQRVSKRWQALIFRFQYTINFKELLPIMVRSKQWFKSHPEQTDYYLIDQEFMEEFLKKCPSIRRVIFLNSDGSPGSGSSCSSSGRAATRRQTRWQIIPYNRNVRTVLAKTRFIVEDNVLSLIGKYCPHLTWITFHENDSIMIEEDALVKFAVHFAKEIRQVDLISGESGHGINDPHTHLSIYNPNNKKYLKFLSLCNIHNNIRIISGPSYLTPFLRTECDDYRLKKLNVINFDRFTMSPKEVQHFQVLFRENKLIKRIQLNLRRIIDNELDDVPLDLIPPDHPLLHHSLSQFWKCDIYNDLFSTISIGVKYLNHLDMDFNANQIHADDIRGISVGLKLMAKNSLQLRRLSMTNMMFCRCVDKEVVRDVEEIRRKKGQSGVQAKRREDNGHDDGFPNLFSWIGLEEFTQLECLTLSGTYHERKTPNVDPEEEEAVPFAPPIVKINLFSIECLKNCPNLKELSLDLNNCSSLHQKEEEKTEGNGTEDKDEVLMSHFLDGIADYIPQIERLSLNCISLTDGALKQTSRLTKLISLSLCCDRKKPLHVTDDGLIQLVTNCWSLKQLRLKNWSNMSHKWLDSLVGMAEERRKSSKDVNYLKVYYHQTVGKRILNSLVAKKKIPNNLMILFL